MLGTCSTCRWCQKEEMDLPVNHPDQETRQVISWECRRYPESIPVAAEYGCGEWAEVTS